MFLVPKFCAKTEFQRSNKSVLLKSIFWKAISRIATIQCSWKRARMLCFALFKNANYYKVQLEFRKFLTCVFFERGFKRRIPVWFRLCTGNSKALPLLRRICQKEENWRCPVLCFAREIFWLVVWNLIFFYFHRLQSGISWRLPVRLRLSMVYSPNLSLMCKLCSKDFLVLTSHAKPFGLVVRHVNFPRLFSNPVLQACFLDRSFSAQSKFCKVESLRSSRDVPYHVFLDI